MRREWSAWIKNRQWHEFEKLAKTDPSQPLADTVAELERGFPDKSDRKALKKVLFLLSRAGVTPNPIDEQDKTNSREDTVEYGLFSTASHVGEIQCSYGFVKEGKHVLLHVLIHATRGIIQASEQELPTEKAEKWLAELDKKVNEFSLVARVPARFALGRISEAVKHSSSLPAVIAFWRNRIDEVPECDHPAQAFSGIQTEPDEWPSCFELTGAATWRLELGEAVPAIDAMVRIYNQPELSEEEKKAEADKATDALRVQVFTPSVISDHVRRLEDLAYILQLREEAGSEIAMSYAEDLRKNGGNSRYAREILSRTIFATANALRSTAERKSVR